MEDVMVPESSEVDFHTSPNDASLPMGMPAYIGKMEKAIDRQRVLLRHLQPSPSSSVPGGGSPLISVRGSPRSLSIGDSMDRLGLFSWCALLYPRFTISYRTDMSISCRYGTELYQVYQSSIGPVRAKCIERCSLCKYSPKRNETKGQRLPIWGHFNVHRYVCSGMGAAAVFERGDTVDGLTNARRIESHNLLSKDAM
ncbi:hypothetical protein BHM03_00038741 [Ensete ventricosum]|nr:hypothetical protein BHM03_00038741 [Ensete ventricosum]